MTYDFKAIFNNPFEKLEEINPEDRERTKFWYHGMYAVIEQNWVSELAQWIQELIDSKKISGCYEVMAGRGWLANALSLKGIEISASDNFSDDSRNSLDEYLTELVYPVYNQEADDVADEITDLVSENPSNRYLVILCYPNEKTKAAERFVKNLPTGTLVVYIGDPNFQITATVEFKKAVTWFHSNPNHIQSHLNDDFPRAENVIQGYKYGGGFLNCVIWLGIV